VRIGDRKGLSPRRPGSGRVRQRHGHYTGVSTTPYEATAKPEDITISTRDRRVPQEAARCRFWRISDEETGVIDGDRSTRSVDRRRLSYGRAFDSLCGSETARAEDEGSGQLKVRTDGIAETRIGANRRRLSPRGIVLVKEPDRFRIPGDRLRKCSRTEALRSRRRRRVGYSPRAIDTGGRLNDPAGTRTSRSNERFHSRPAMLPQLVGGRNRFLGENERLVSFSRNCYEYVDRRLGPRDTTPDKTPWMASPPSRHNGSRSSAKLSCCSGPRRPVDPMGNQLVGLTASAGQIVDTRLVLRGAERSMRLLTFNAATQNHIPNPDF